MSELKVSVSGIRGVWGDSLTLPVLFDYTQAFGQFVLARKGRKVLMGRDARPTGEMISQYCASVLNAMGLHVSYAGIVPTPTVLFGVRNLGFDAGIIITASHNPVEWNALKFVKKEGTFTGEQDVEEIRGYLGRKAPAAAYDKIGRYEKDDSPVQAHVDKIIGNVRVLVIKNRKFKVVLDPVNSAGGAITQKLFASLGCEVKMINGEITGSFGRGTEPTPKNLTHLEKIIRDTGADAGFAQDPDADRLVLIDEKGRVLSEEWTLALAAESVLSRKKGDVVTNVSTSMVMSAVAEKYGGRNFHTKVGEANVSEGIVKRKAVIGGEGNGGVIYPAINLARDSLVGIALVLELMAVTGKKLSELADALPNYTMVKEKFDFRGDLKNLYRKAGELFPGSVADDQDGLRLDWKEGPDTVWVHVRPSNTEPVVRVIGESSDAGKLKAAMDKIKKLMS